MTQKRWGFDPNSGGKKILEDMKRQVTQRIEKFAAENYAGKYTQLDIRFRGQFCYIDAFTEPYVSEGWPPEDWPESRVDWGLSLGGCRGIHWRRQRAAVKMAGNQVGEHGRSSVAAMPTASAVTAPAQPGESAGGRSAPPITGACL